MSSTNKPDACLATVDDFDALLDDRVPAELATEVLGRAIAHVDACKMCQRHIARAVDMCFDEAIRNLKNRARA